MIHRPDIYSRRLPNVRRIHTSADDSGSGHPVQCPECRQRMIWDGLRINNYFCPYCGFEPERSESQKPNEEKDTFAEGFISTIDGYIDVGTHAKTNTTAKFRPVEGPRSHIRTPDVPDSVKELEARGMKVLDVKEWSDKDGVVDMRSNLYDPRTRRRDYY